MVLNRLRRAISQEPHPPMLDSLREDDIEREYEGSSARIFAHPSEHVPTQHFKLSLTVYPVAGYSLQICPHVIICGHRCSNGRGSFVTDVECTICKKSWAYNIISFFDVENS